MRKRIVIAAMVVAAGAGAAGCTEPHGMIVVSPPERLAALTEAQAELAEYVEWAGYDPSATGEACALFRSADAVEPPSFAGPIDEVALPGLAGPINEVARDGQDLGVRGTARALADWVAVHGIAEVPASLVSGMRTACYAYELSGAAISAMVAGSGGHSYEGL